MLCDGVEFRTAWERLTDAQREGYRSQWRREAAEARAREAQRRRDLAALNQARADDWAVVAASYQAETPLPADKPPPPRPNGSTPRRPTLRREMILARRDARDAAGEAEREAEIDRALARGLARLTAHAHGEG